MRTAAFMAAGLFGLGLLLECCTSGEGPRPGAAPPLDAASSDGASPPRDAAAPDAAPFVLPPPAPYDSPTCHHGAMPARCDDRWCTLPKGCFLMGTPETEVVRARYGEEQREVSFTHDLLISKHETTQAEWVATGLPNPSKANQRPDLVSDCLEPRCPVGDITWWDAWVFANLENDRAGLPHCAEPRDCKGTPGNGLVCARIEQLVPSLYECEGFRLPTRSEFEYAARGGTLTEFYSGKMTGDGEGPEPHLREIAWFTQNSGHTTHPVEQKLPNHWGLFDMLGNAVEWVTEEEISSANPPGPLVDFRGVLHPTDDSALVRGGAANAPPWSLRAGGRSLGAVRWAHGPGGSVRLVRSLPHLHDAGAPDAAPADASSDAGR